MAHPLFYRPLALACLALLLASCGGGGSSGVTTPTTPPPATSAPVFTIKPADQARLEGEEVSFDAQATGEDVHYQWLLNGTPLAGETNSFLSVTGQQSAGSESVWTVEARNAGGVVRASARLKVLPNMQPILIAGQPNRNTSNERPLLQNDMSGLALDNAGNYLLVDAHKINRLTLDGRVSTFTRPAGWIVPAICPGGAVTADQGDTLYWIDSCMHMVWKISAGGAVTPFAGGSGGEGYADGQGSAARFAFPAAGVLDRAGNLFVADSFNGLLRKITPAGVVTTLAGGAAQPADGQGGKAGFQRLHALAIDQQDNLYVADNYSIRKVTPAGLVSTLAGSGVAEYNSARDGNGTAATFAYPHGLAVDGNGVVFVSDTGNRAIRKITPGGTVTTIAGDPTMMSGIDARDGIGSEAVFGYKLSSIALDANGNLQVGDAGFGVRQVTPAGVVTTPVMVPALLSGAHLDGKGLDARFDGTGALAFDRQGLLHVVERKAVSTVAADGAVGTRAAIAAVGIAFDAQDNMYTTEPSLQPDFGEIWKTTPAGKRSIVYTIAQSTGMARYSFTDLAVDTGGNVYAAGASSDERSGSPHGTLLYCKEGYVHRITPDGSATVFAGLQPGDAPPGVTMSCAASSLLRDRDGNFWVGDGHSRTIRKISPNGSITNTGLFLKNSWTTNMALTPDGGLVFTDGYVVRLMTPGGAVTSVARLDGYAAGLAVDANGDLFLSMNSAIYKLALPK